MANESNFDNLDPQELIEGLEGPYDDPTPPPVQPDEPDYVEPAAGVHPVPTADRPTGDAARDLGACFICGDPANHGGAPHNTATGESRFRADVR